MHHFLTFYSSHRLSVVPQQLLYDRVHSHTKILVQKELVQKVFIFCKTTIVYKVVRYKMWVAHVAAKCVQLTQHQSGERFLVSDLMRRGNACQKLLNRIACSKSSNPLLFSFLLFCCEGCICILFMEPTPNLIFVNVIYCKLCRHLTTIRQHIKSVNFFEIVNWW